MRWFLPVVCTLFVIVCSFLLSHLNSDLYLRASDVEYLYDPTGTQSIESVLLTPFTKSQKKTIPPLSKVVWIKVKVPELVNQWMAESVFFTGSNETATSMNGYLVQGSMIEALGFCDVLLEASDCRIASLQYAFPIKKKIEGNVNEQILFVKIVPGASGTTNEFYFMKKTFFNRVTIFLDHFIGVATGIFLLISALSLLFFISLKEESFLVYSLFYLNLFFSILVNRGIWDAFKPDFITFTGATLLLPILILTVFFDLMFLRVYFEIPKKNKNLNVVFTLFLGLILGLLFMSFLPTTKILAWKALGPAVFGSMLLALLTLIYFVWQGRLWAESVASAWGVAIACNFIWTGYRAGLIEGYWFFGYYAILGRVLEGFILNNVIFQKIKNLNIKVGFAKAKSEEGAIVKTLLRTLSHDLSNTTQLIESCVQVISENQNPELLARNIQYIREAARSQADIIENAKSNFLVRGGQIVNLGPIDLRACITETVEFFKMLLSKKKLNLNVSLPKSSERLMVLAERTTLCHQVLANLLSNAAKFTHSGKAIYIDISVKDDDWIELKVRDEGVGIPNHILDRLFDESESVSRPGTQGELGSGTGLLNVKDFVTAYGGKVSCTSVVEQGTEITVLLKRFNL